MITEQAIVTRCHGKQVELTVQQSGCGQCELKQGCGTGAIGRLLGQRARPLMIDNEYNLDCGDHLVLGFAERALVKVSLLVYGLPLIAMLFSGLLASILGVSSDAWLLTISVAGFYLGFKLGVRVAASSDFCRVNPQIIEISGNSESSLKS